MDADHQVRTDRDHAKHDPSEDRGGGHGSHDAGHGDHAEMFRRLFWINLALAVPVLVLSEQIQDWFGYNLTFPGSSWVPPVLGTVIYFYGGRPFLSGGVSEARERQPGMMLLIALAITVAFVASLVSLTDALDLEFWWELASLIVIMLLGHWQEMRAIGQAQGALAALAELIPDEAERIEDGGETQTVPIADLAVGDRVLVRSGSRVPADGTITDGSVELDESMLTGESNPVARSEGDEVVAGSVATDNAIRVEITAIGEDTALGGIQRLVSEAQESGSRAQALADRAAALLFYVAIVSAVLTAGVWLALGDPDQALIRTITSVHEGYYVVGEKTMNHDEVVQWIEEKIGRLAGSLVSDSEDLFVPLSPREMEILEHVTRGLSNKEIAYKLGISHQTVKNHMTAILRKLRVDDRTQAAVYALHRGWVRLETTRN